MKKYSCVVSFVILFCLIIACQDNAAMAELEKFRAQAKVEDQNAALVRQFFKAIDTQDYGRFNELLAPGALSVVNCTTLGMKTKYLLLP